jgi:hypothetical protein
MLPGPFINSASIQDCKQRLFGDDYGKGGLLDYAESVGDEPRDASDEDFSDDDECQSSIDEYSLTRHEDVRINLQLLERDSEFKALADKLKASEGYVAALTRFGLPINYLQSPRTNRY